MQQVLDLDPSAQPKATDEGILSPELANIIQQVFDLEIRMRPILRDTYHQMWENRELPGPTLKYDTIRELQEAVGKLADDCERQLPSDIEDILEA